MAGAWEPPRRDDRAGVPPLLWALAAVAAWVALSVVLGVLFGSAVLRVMVAGSDSMAPTITQGQRFVADVTAYRRGDVRRGDVVVYAPELEDAFVPAGRVRRTPPRYVQRVVAVGGDTVECCDTSGRVLLNGRPLDEPYVRSRQDRFDPVTVPPGEVFTMGDNRARSIDSRIEGPLPERLLRGRVLGVRGNAARAAPFAAGAALAAVPVLLVALPAAVVARRRAGTRREAA